MLKKIVIGTLVAAMSGALIYGAINRTQAKDNHVSSERSIRQNASRSEQPLGQSGNQSGEDTRLGRNQNGGGQGTQNQSTAIGKAVEPVEAAQVKDWNSVLGTVQEVTEEALFVQLDGGEVLTIEGMTLRFALEQGFTTSEDHRILMTGFFENDEFVPGEIMDLSSGLSVVLREDRGRPLWAGGRGWSGL